MPPKPLDLLRRVFGYAQFRDRQAAIIDRVIAGGDTLVLMPLAVASPSAIRSPPWCVPVPASSSRP